MSELCIDMRQRQGLRRLHAALSDTCLSGGSTDRACFLLVPDIRLHRLQVFRGVVLNRQKLDSGSLAEAHENRAVEPVELLG